MSEKSMVIITANLGQVGTFRMIPIEETCPYIEVVYDKELGGLIVFSKEKKEQFLMMPKLDDSGAEIPIGPKRMSTTNIKVERKVIEKWYEYFISENEEVISFVNMFAKNADTYDYMSYLKDKA